MKNRARIEDLRDHIGRIVMSHHSDTNIPTTKRHGPWVLLEVTKGGMAIIRKVEGDDREISVKPSLLEIVY